MDRRISSAAVRFSPVLKSRQVIGTVAAAAAMISALPMPALAAESSTLFDMPLEQLMQIEIDTASRRPGTWREQPGVITVFTAEDMIAMGARTLLDVVQRIPGTSLGIDGRNSIGLIMRGSWTLEGKVLVLLNDMPLNELLYGSWSPLPYIPVGQLERIEVLRGPGSTQYGGSAQLAVIRIFTRQPNGHNDGRIDYTALSQSGQPTHMAGISQHFSDGAMQGAVSVSANRGVWGNETWVDNTGQAVDTADAGTNGSTVALTADLSERDHLHFYHEQFDIDALQGFGTAQPQGVVLLNRSLLHYSRDFRPGSTLTLNPHVNYRHDNLRVRAPEEPTVYDMTSANFGGGLDLRWDLDARNQLSGGFEYQNDRAAANSADGPFFPRPADRYFGDSDEVNYERNSAYADWNLKLDDYILILGARASHHQHADDAVTPRAGLTRASDNWHFKWLYGEAFREPNIETINYGTTTGNISPERTRVHELEVGHRLLAQGYLTLSLFNQRTLDSIIFSQDQINEFTYNNNPTMRSYGTELQYIYRTARISLQANYSWTRSNDNELPVYDVPGQSGQYLGAPAQVGNLWLSLATPVQQLTALLGARYVGERTALDYDTTLSLQTLRAEFTMNAALRYEVRQAALTLGVDNLLDEDQRMPQPYAGLSTPFPYGSRTIWMRAEWQWN